MIRLASIGLGYGLLALGVIGIVLPVLHGTIFFVVGLLILSRHAQWAARWLQWLKGRNERFARLIERGEAMVDRGEAWLATKLGRSFGAPPSS